MGNISIAKSFKGILRVSPIIDGPEKDEFLIESYYKNFNPAFKEASDSPLPVKTVKLDFSDGSYNATTKALSSELEKYKSDDIFYKGKLQVSDSVGNYMNINVGRDGTVFGSVEDEHNNNDFGTNNFPVLEADHLVIGVENRKTHINKKRASEGSLHIVEGTNEAKIVFENNFSQSDINNAKDYTEGSRCFTRSIT